MSKPINLDDFLSLLNSEQPRPPLQERGLNMAIDEDRRPAENDSIANSLTNQIEITVLPSQPYHTPCKGLVERAFGNLNLKFLETLALEQEEGSAPNG